MDSPHKAIVKFLADNKVPFDLITHEPVYTSEQAAKVRGMSAEMGAKALLLKTSDEFIMAVLPGSKRLNSKKLKEILKVKALRFATPQEVEEIMHCQIGSCYPFGNLINIKTIVDPSLGNNEIIAFNIGLHNKSIKIKWEDYLRVVKPSLNDITEH